MPKIAMNGDAARLSQEKKKKKKAQNLVLINSQVTLINGISQNGISIKYLSPVSSRDQQSLSSNSRASVKAFHNFPL